MFWNIYSKRILSTLRDKETLVWTWIFPIMMATLFFVTFSSLDTVEQLQTIPIGVIDNESYQQEQILQTVLQSVSADNDEQLFHVTFFQNTDEADAVLENGEIEGYIKVDATPKFIVKDDGMNQTIVKSFLDRYLQTKYSIEKIIMENPSAVQEISAWFHQKNFTQEISVSQNPPTDKVNYFYALLAMICMYGGFQGLRSVTLLQANLSPLGARRTMAPAGHFRVMFYDLLGGITVHLLCLITLIFYIIFVLGVNFGSRLSLVLLTCLVGSLVGVSFGTLVSVTSKLKETAKTAVLISITMVCCFFAGLMTSGINYVVAEKAPLAAWLNPAARITDAFYCLYYYDTYDRYLINMGVLLLMALVLFGLTAVFVRRQRYESL